MSSPEAKPGDDVTRTNLSIASLLVPGTLVAGRYRISRLIGVGGMGMVYLALDEELDLDVALKVLRPEAADREDMRDRFRLELILARKVSHRNVVRIHDMGFDGELCFITMDYVEGHSLKDALREGPLEPEQVEKILRQLVSGLVAAHGEGVVHRDLKPGNILLDDRDRAFVSDFGLARSLGSSGFTRTGSVVGTLGYLSPEQARGEPADHRSDLYAVGLMVFEMLSGELPFEGGTIAESLAQRVSGTPRTLAAVGVEAPEALQRVVERCLAKERADRYQDAQSILDDLDGRGPVLPPKAESPGSPPFKIENLWRRLEGYVARRPLAAVLLGVLLLTVVLGASLLLPRFIPPLHRPSDTVEIGVPTVEKHAVAVLPLADETLRQDLAWTSTGVAEMIAETMAESPELRVIDSVRVFRTLKDLHLGGTLANSELRLVAELLDVDRLVLGRIRTVEDQVRIDLRLVHLGPAGEDLSEDRLSGEARIGKEVFPLVEDLGARLLEHLRASPAIAQPSISASFEALSAYNDSFEPLQRSDPLTALPFLEQAVEADPTFAAAWNRLAVAYEDLGFESKALAAARKAAETAASSGRSSYQARARAASLEGEPAKARQVLTELVERYPQDVEGRVQLAEMYGAEGRFQEASSLLEEVVRREPNHPRAWYRLGVFAVLQGENRRAADDYLVRALVVQSRLGHERGKAAVLNAFGAALEGLGELDQAAQRYQEAAEIRHRVGDQGGYADSLSNLAAIDAARGKYDSARAGLRQALEIRREIGDRGGTVSLENFLGALEEQQGRYRQALEHYRLALDLWRELGDLRGVAESSANLGFASLLVGDYASAEQFLGDAQKQYREAENREGEILATQGLAQLQLARGEWNTSARSFLEALEASRELGLRHTEAVSLGNLGRVAQAQGRYRGALESYRSARDLLKEVAGAARGVAEYRLLEAGALLEIGAIDAAETQLNTVGEDIEETVNLEQRAELQRLTGVVSLARGQPQQARRHFQAAFTDAAASGSKVSELRARLGLAQSQLQAGALEEAEAAARALTEDAELVQNTLLQLEAGLTLATILRNRGKLVEAQRVVRSCLDLAQDREPYAGSYLLSLELAKILRLRGQEEAADGALAQATDALERLRDNLDEPFLEQFNQRPEVENLGRQSPDRAPTALARR